MISTKHALEKVSPTPEMVFVLKRKHVIVVVFFTHQPIQFLIPKWLQQPPISLFLSAPNSKFQSLNPLSSSIPPARTTICASNLIIFLHTLFPPLATQGYAPPRLESWIPPLPNPNPPFPPPSKLIWVIGAIPFTSGPGY